MEDVDLSKQKVLVVWGDSHADHLIGALETADGQKRFALLSRPQGLCPPLLNVIPAKRGRPFEPCSNFNSDVLAEVLAIHAYGQLDSVVLSAHWALYTDKPKLAGGIGVPVWKDGRWFRGDEAPIALAEGLRAMLQKLTANGIRVMVVAPMAEQPFRVPACLARRSARACSSSRQMAEDHRRVALQAVKKAVSGLKDVYLWDPLPALCQGDVCWAERGNLIMYRDGDHLTYAGARWLGSYLAASPEWKAFLNGSM